MSDYDCPNCGQNVTLHENCEPTDYCDGCVHTYIDTLQEKLSTLEREKMELEARCAALMAKHDKVTEFVSRFLVPWRTHLPDSWLNGFVECGAVTIDKSYPHGFVEPVKASPDAGRELLQRVDRMDGALKEIKAMTDADNPESYRCDDREGCLDAVFATAKQALEQLQTEGGE